MKNIPQIPHPNINGKNKLFTPDNSFSSNQHSNLTMDFTKFHMQSINIRGKFNNHYKDLDHFCNVTSGFLGKILPKITSHTYNELCAGTPDGRGLHFHPIDQEHQEIVREILQEYQFSNQNIEQILEGNSLFNFSATLGHTSPARVICQKIDNILYPLFLDVNHHVYMNEKYTKDSFFYDSCPIYTNNKCTNMPFECYAVSYLDEAKLEATYGYSLSP